MKVFKNLFDWPVCDLSLIQVETVDAILYSYGRLKRIKHGLYILYALHDDIAELEIRTDIYVIEMPRPADIVCYWMAQTKCFACVVCFCICSHSPMAVGMDLASPSNGAEGGFEAMDTSSLPQRTQSHAINTKNYKQSAMPINQQKPKHIH